eukprot:gene5551-4005_t
MNGKQRNREHCFWSTKHLLHMNLGTSFSFTFCCSLYFAAFLSCLLSIIYVTPNGSGLWYRNQERRGTAQCRSEVPALTVELSPLGATLISCKLFCPEKKEWIEVNCGYQDYPKEAAADTDYMGVTVGRSAGRIANGRFMLDGKTYITDKNMNNQHTCHGGFNAYHKKMWSFVVATNSKRVGVTFSYTSPHMENGMPGEVLSKASYYIPVSKPSTLVMEYHAEVTKNSPAAATCVNMFNHAYWNLNGVPRHSGSGPWPQPEKVLNHWVRIPASRVAEADRYAITTGKFLPVDGTVLDFRKGKVVSEGINDPSLDRDPSGFDHPWAVDGYQRNKLSLNAIAYSPSSNIKLTVSSTYPCIWLYTANNKPEPATGLPGCRYARYTGIGLEPQYFPDTPNRPEFPSCTIRRGQNTFHEKIVNEEASVCWFPLLEWFRGMNGFIVVPLPLLVRLTFLYEEKSKRSVCLFIYLFSFPVFSITLALYRDKPELSPSVGDGLSSGIIVTVVFRSPLSIQIYFLRVIYCFWCGYRTMKKWRRERCEICHVPFCVILSYSSALSLCPFVDLQFSLSLLILLRPSSIMNKVSKTKKSTKKTPPKVVLCVEEKDFGPGKLITLKSPALQVSISTLGATLQSVKVYHPKKKVWTEVSVHYTKYEEALADCGTYFGATVGRFAGRVGHGRFTLENVEYYTPKNAGEHTIHGGGNTFDKKHWSYELMDHHEESVGVRFTYRSPHMENGFPAELQCSVYYYIPLLKPAALHMQFDAFIPETSPASSTIVNMFNHAYWNLNGIPPRSDKEDWKQPETVHNHVLRLPDCHHLIQTDSAAVPSGEVVPVRGAFDFLAPRAIGDGINKAELNRNPCGYDHPYAIDRWRPGQPPRLNAAVYSPSSEIKMEVLQQPKGKAAGTPGERYGRHTAVCLEPQHFPDAANHENFPQSVVRRGLPYHEEIINVFSIQPKDKPSKL